MFKYKLVSGLDEDLEKVLDFVLSLDSTQKYIDWYLEQSDKFEESKQYVSIWQDWYKEEK